MNNGKKMTAIASIALLTTGLAACNNNAAMDDNNGTQRNGNAQPIGYYSNENTNVDNEGPVTELLDGRYNGENQGNTANNRNDKNQQNSLQQVNDQNNGNNRITPLVNNDNNKAGDNRYSKSDENYHGHLNNDGYYNRSDRDMSEKVKKTVEKMDNVDNANVLVTENNILVAVDTNDNNDKSMKEQITNKLREMSKGRNVQVVTDEGTLTRVRNINNNINNGAERKSIDADINNLMNDLGDAIKRPFNGNQNQ